MTTDSAESGAPALPDDPAVYLSVVIPAYNEERRLTGSLERIRAYLDERPYRAEVIVVENASRDRTWEVANAAAERDSRIRVLREPVRGKGAAVRRGMLAARGDYRFLCDADLSMPIEEVERFLPPAISDVDVVVGSREAPGAVRYDEPGRRHLMGRVFNTLVRGSLVPGIQDTQCGFKCFRATAAQEIFERVTRKGFGFDVEALVIARRFGHSIREIPVDWYFDADSRVRVVRDSLGTIGDVLAIWLKRARGDYDPARPVRRR